MSKLTALNEKSFFWSQLLPESCSSELQKHVKRKTNYHKPVNAYKVSENTTISRSTNTKDCERVMDVETYFESLQVFNKHEDFHFISKERLFVAKTIKKQFVYDLSLVWDQKCECCFQI